ncbi:MAG: 6-phosphofructokinase [Beijerinckiaceae bacterium]|nr:6-phosphofructokinase [Beijerinckiaceae bacterium]
MIGQSCDYIKQSASSSRKRVFVVDVHGGYCGFLATMAAITAGGTRAYIHEEGGIHLSDLQRDAQHLQKRFLDDRKQGRLIIRNEFSSETYSAELISKILEEESQGAFDSRWVVLGHLQQGGSPSPLDRIRGIRLAVLAMSYIEARLAPPDQALLDSLRDLSADPNSPAVRTPDGDEASDSGELGESGSSTDDGVLTGLDPADAMMIGIRGPRVRLIPASRLLLNTDIKLRRPKEQWWMGLRRYARILAGYDTEFPPDGGFL